MQFRPSLLLLLCVCLSGLTADLPFESAVRAFEAGDFPSAERTLRALLGTSHSGSQADSQALGLLGAVLDNEGKYGEAETVYKQAIQLTPRSATLLNNFANHQLTTGNKTAARATYLKVVALDPARSNANLQLAQFAVDDKDGPAAARYLSRVPSSAAAAPQVQILQLQSLYLNGRNSEAAALLSRLENTPDPRLAFSAGLALAAIARYPEAETLFAHVAQTEPANFDVLYNLGLAAFHARHLDRARDVLSSALAQRPSDVDALFSLAAVNIDGKQQEAALRLLAEASRLDPGRADVQLALAQTASALGFYADARLAYERYLKLHPQDANAEREHIFTVALSQQPREGLQQLKAFTQAHGNDPAAHYEVGVLEAKSDPLDAAAHFDRALSLQPDYGPARLGRGTLRYLEGKPAEALPDLRFAAAHYPDNPTVFDRLGETYTALNQPSQAIAALTHASDLAPRDSRILMHLSRAQAKAGDSPAARLTLSRFRALGPQPGNLIPQAGVVDFLALPVAQQESRYVEEVTRRVAEHPDDPDLNKRYLEVLLYQKKWSDLPPVVQRLVEARPPVTLASEAAASLLEAKQYDAARPVLDYVAADGSAMPAVQLWLALVDLHTTGAIAGLTRLNSLQGPTMSGDYWLTRALLLESAGRHTDAVAALANVEISKPQSLLLYSEAVPIFQAHGDAADARKLVEFAETTLPNNPGTDLLRAGLGL